MSLEQIQMNTHPLITSLLPLQQQAKFGFDLPVIHRPLLVGSAAQTCPPCLQLQIPTGPHLGAHTQWQRYSIDSKDWKPKIKYNIINNVIILTKYIFAILTINQTFAQHHQLLSYLLQVALPRQHWTGLLHVFPTWCRPHSVFSPTVSTSTMS